MVDGSGVSSQFQRAFARLDEVRAQYHADRERMLADDEARQTQLRTLAEENKAKDEQTLAAVAARETVAPQARAEPGNAWAKRRAGPVEEDESFGFEEDPVAAQGPPAARPTPVTSAVPAPPPPRPGAWEEDDFSGTDWTSDEQG
ncbi:hypothetical protein [Amycolatopsis aidingensis]|uniref:hypothetical protein n=1 Tax=Amycolatopsis aidingensis TaxID=2842453 RepID=UPI001C0BE1EC|nr:hypothetical protein [Amycolatopsis aidingensis]